MAKLSRTGPIREGFEYQDLYGALMLVDWLAHPANFQWIRFEAGEFGSLDDIATCTPNNELHLIQVKHTTERPDRLELELNELVEKENDSKRSLFEKWFASWARAFHSKAYQSIRATLYTNRPPSPEMVTLLKNSGQAIDIHQLKNLNLAFYEEMQRQAGKDSHLLDQFLADLEFKSRQPDIPVIRELLVRNGGALNLTEAAVHDIEKAVWDWAVNSTRLTLHDVKRACGWIKLHPFDENFPIPKDYVAVGTDLIDDFVEISKRSTGGAHMISGSPGAGKSTFLAKLHETLLQHEVVCIRHHFYIPGSDSSEEFRRLQYLDAASALLSQLFYDAPDYFPHVNPRADELPSILASACNQLQNEGKALVIIVDGLDHVVRDENEIELERLLKSLLPLPSGLRLIFGTRPISSRRIQNLLGRFQSPDRWIPMPAMSNGDCGTLLQQHQSELRIHENEFDSAVSAFHDVTEGHPLHARYSLSALQQIAREHPIWANDVWDLQPFAGDLTQFYSRLWDQLAEAGRYIGVLLAVAQFPLAQDEIVTILTPIVTPIDLMSGFDVLLPLLRKNANLALEFFHPSFLEFIRSTSEFSAYKSVTLMRLVQWLEQAAPEETRWSWLLRKKYDLADVMPLINATTRPWLIQALYDGREVGAILGHLRLASAAAMQRDDYGIALRKTWLRIYLENSQDSESDEWDTVELLSRRLRGRALNAKFDHDLRRRSSSFLAELALDADQIGHRKVISRIVSELNNRIREADRQTREAEFWRVVQNLVLAASLLRGKVDRLAEFVSSFTSQADQSRVAAYVTTSMVETSQATALQEFISQNTLAETTRQAALMAAAKSAVHQHRDIGLLSDIANCWVAIYNNVIKGVGSEFGFAFPAPTTLPLELDEFPSETEREETSQALESLYAIGIYSGLTGKEEAYNQWASQISAPSWPETIVVALAEMGVTVGTSIRLRQWKLTDAIMLSSKVRKLRFDTDRDMWGLRSEFLTALRHVLPSSMTLVAEYCNELIGDAELSAIKLNPHLTSQEMLDILLELQPRLLSAKAISDFVVDQARICDGMVSDFPSRSRLFLSISGLGVKVGASDIAALYLKRSISNLLAYRYHKDMALYEVLRAVEACLSIASAEQMKRWLTRLAPIANAIEDFTDGDETGDSLADFGKILSRGFSQSARRLYIDLIQRERLFLADRVFRYILANLNLKDGLESAIAKTAIDHESRTVLENIAASGSVEATDIVLELDRLYGDMAPEGEANSGMAPIREKTQFPVDAVPANAPQQLIEKLYQFDIPYDRSVYASAWFAHWSKVDARAAYVSISEWLKNASPISVDFDLLYALVPHAREFDGPEAEFRLLCQAHSAIYGWSVYSGKERPERVLAILESDFPTRWRDFIRCTLSGNTPEHYSSLPVPAGVQFLIKFGAHTEALDLTDAAVSSVVELIADLELPTVPWPESEAAPVDVLISRLLSISGAVRGRTAVVMADLLLSPFAEQVFAGLVRRLESEQLESRIPVLLMPILRAIRSGYQTDISDLEKKILASSRASEGLVAEMKRAAAQYTS